MNTRAIPAFHLCGKCRPFGTAAVRLCETHASIVLALEELVAALPYEPFCAVCDESKGVPHDRDFACGQAEALMAKLKG